MTVLLPATTETDLKKINLSIQQLGAGRSNAVGTITLTAGTTTVITTVTGTCAPGSVPILVPTSATAAAIVWRISSVGRDTFTVTTSTAAAGSETFLYAILG